MAPSGYFTSKTDQWGTPLDLFNLYNDAYGFQLDAAASSENALCKNFFTVDDNGLEQDWWPRRRVWVNPPYGRTIGHWARKAFEESQKGCIVVCLLPVRTSAKWWHDWVKDKAYLDYVPGRLKFRNLATDGKPGGTAPFSSVLATYVPNASLHTSYAELSAQCTAARSRASRKR